MLAWLRSLADAWLPFSCLATMLGRESRVESRVETSQLQKPTGPTYDASSVSSDFSGHIHGSIAPWPCEKGFSGLERNDNR